MTTMEVSFQATNIYLYRNVSGGEQLRDGNYVTVNRSMQYSLPVRNLSRGVTVARRGPPDGEPFKSIQ